MMNWDPTVNLGTLIAMVGISVTILVTYISTRVRIETLISTLVARLAALSDRVDNVEKMADRHSLAINARIQHTEDVVTEHIGVVQKLVGMFEIHLRRRPENGGVPPPGTERRR